MLSCVLVPFASGTIFNFQGTAASVPETADTEKNTYSVWTHDPGVFPGHERSVRDKYMRTDLVQSVRMKKCVCKTGFCLQEYYTHGRNQSFSCSSADCDHAVCSVTAFQDLLPDARDRRSVPGSTGTLLKGPVIHQEFLQCYRLIVVDASRGV